MGKAIVLKVIAAGAISAFLCLAQDAPSVRTGTVEVGGFAGGSYGIDKWRMMGGGNVSYGVTKWLLPYGEYSYFPGIARERSNGNQVLSYVAPLHDIHGGVHIRVPIKESPVVPYGVFGIGVVRSSFSGNATITLPNVPPVPFPLTESNTDAAINWGGGLRFYVNEMWGFRAEFKAYRPITGPYSNLFYKAVGGIFIQLR